MARMMAKKYQPQVITDPAAQARLAKIHIADDGHQNGGLMKQMMASRYPGKVISDEKAQEQLAQVRIPAGSGNGGLMAEMQSAEKADILRVTNGQILKWHGGDAVPLVYAGWIQY